MPAPDGWPVGQGRVHGRLATHAPHCWRPSMGAWVLYGLGTENQDLPGFIFMGGPIRFIDDGGNNFWGVEVHKHPNGQKYVLASDRDSGVYLFQYTGN